MLDKKTVNKHIKIIVKGKELFNEIFSPDFNIANIEKIVDNQTELIEVGGSGRSAYGDRNKDFITETFDGCEIEWSIELNDNADILEGYTAILESLKQNLNSGKTGFFTNNPIYKNNEGNIVATVSGKNIPLNSNEDYTLYFRITKGPKPTPTTIIYTTPVIPLDPKLQMKT